jgi:3-phenylpropionate/cinnamic acid dioxygenase small subunit
MDVRTDNAGPVEDVILSRIERFLYQEAALLDRRDYGAWWKVLADDIQYRVTAKVNRDASIGSLEFSLIDENAGELKQRVDQISTPRLTHAENPPSVTRRFVTNVMAQRGAAQNEFQVTANLLVYRTTVDLVEGSLYSGARQDVLREVDDTFRLVKRVVHLDQAIMFGAVSILF